MEDELYHFDLKSVHSNQEKCKCDVFYNQETFILNFKGNKLFQTVQNNQDIYYNRYNVLMNPPPYQIYHAYCTHNDISNGICGL